MVYFDFSAAQPLQGSVHGGGEYARSVLSALVENGFADRLILLVDERRALPNYFEQLVNRERLNCRYFDSRASLQAILGSGKATRYYSALPYDFSSLDLASLDLVFTIHGLRPIELPTDRYEYLYAPGAAGVLKWVAKQALTSRYVRSRLREFQQLVSTASRSTQVVVPSEHTRGALASFLDIPDRVSVHTLYSPTTTVIATENEDPSVINEFGLEPRRYLLLVSGNRWIKNAYRALVAIGSLQRRTQVLDGFDIVVTGGLPPRLRKLDVDNLKTLPYINHEQLKALYSHAFALVYPTLNEGFGYPPIEAMACGTPVISSDACSLPEIAGDAPLYFDPFDPTQIEDRVSTLVRNPELWEERVRASRERYAIVSARQHRDLLELCRLITG